MGDKILTAPEVARYLKLSKSKVYALLQNGKIPHIRLGRNVRVRETDLVAWLEKMSMTPPPIYQWGKEVNGNSILREDEIAAILGLPRKRIDSFIEHHNMPLEEGEFVEWFVENAKIVLRVKFSEYYSKIGIS